MPLKRPLGQKTDKASQGAHIRPTGETQEVPNRIPKDPRLLDPLEFNICLEPSNS